MNKIVEDIAQFVRISSSVDIMYYEKSFLEKIITERSSITKCNGFNGYFEFLKLHPDEIDIFLSSFQNSYSEFFRNPITFAVLEQLVIPRIFELKNNKTSPEIRLWSAGCASGQEAYSLAILIEEYLSKQIYKSPYRIFASDHIREELVAADKGEYRKEMLRGTKFEYVQKYFLKNNETYSIDSNLKRNIDFSYYNLLEEGSSSPPESIYGGFDLIFCSNVLFYYNTTMKNIILTKLYNSLNNGGFLITGEAEVAIINSIRGFRQYNPLCAIFIKLN